MEYKTIVAIDAMGGDNAPEEIIKGAVEAINERSDIKIHLFGDEKAVSRELAKYSYNQDQVEFTATTEVITPDEPPVASVRQKKDSSLVRAITSVKEGTCDAIVSGGSSGAVLVGGQIIIGKSRGVKRAPLAPLMPTEKGVALLIDCGANVDARPEHLLQFAQMGSIYMKHVVGIDNPKVAIINIGAEEEKGNMLVKAAYPLLKECETINFVGNIESRDLFKGDADVIVTEAFVGNVVLKLIEGLSSTLLHQIKDGMMSSLRGKIGGALVKPAIKNTMKQFDASEHGGAPLLGLKGLVVKIHGSATAGDVRHAVFQCATFKEEKINEKIRDNLTVPKSPQKSKESQA